MARSCASCRFFSICCISRWSGTQDNIISLPSPPPPPPYSLPPSSPLPSHCSSLLPTPFSQDCGICNYQCQQPVLSHLSPVHHYLPKLLLCGICVQLEKIIFLLLDHSHMNCHVYTPTHSHCLVIKLRLLKGCVLLCQLLLELLSNTLLSFQLLFQLLILLFFLVWRGGVRWGWGGGLYTQCITSWRSFC